MIIGVPREIKTDEKRVAITPAGVSAFVGNKHVVLVEKDAGVGSGILDDAYTAAGAQICADVKEIWERADMIIKVKEPLEPEFPLMRKGQVIFTYLHLAADRALTEKLIQKKVIAIAYETIQLDDGTLPLLAPMSEVAGRLSIQMGAYCLEAKNGGSGILLPGVSGVPPAKVVIIGAGIAGASACSVAVGIGARVSILDINPARLRYIHDIMQGHISTLMSNPASVEQAVAGADLVIGAVLIPGSRAPKLITRAMLKRMRRGSALVDIAIDQGGSCETSHPTTHTNPTYIEEGVVHYCVANMPGAVPRTSTYALTNATLQYGLDLANKGWERAVKDNPILKKGVNIAEGNVTHCGVAEAFGFKCIPV
ncbi:MAG: alanine dehydrogenase [Candidatus Abyssobacteria bacterium SURF_17]|uniref:Alanine dehydrogenase n=1 Tax=Candidatus Abyssobacteria bacterium SURF_17 TaxID=2093361 RepID=A0A419ESW1_9BACT|nr:MAG: alanine dehydrogenase [Candidatus Abyssubacteria bacterium SURF_17]